MSGVFDTNVFADDAFDVQRATDARDTVELLGMVAIGGALDATEALDTAEIRGTVVGAAQRPQPVRWSAPTVPRRLPTITGRLAATEAPDVCSMLGWIDWSDDDAEVLLIVLGVAA